MGAIASVTHRKVCKETTSMSRSVQTGFVRRTRLHPFGKSSVGCGVLVVLVLSCFGLKKQALAEEAAAGSEKVATTFIVVRHAEREGNADRLSAQGRDRAEMLRRLGKVLNVSAVYSTNTQRTKNTVKPLVDDLGVKLNLYSRANQAWVNQLHRKNAGGVVLVVGHSNTTGVIAGMLASMRPFTIGHDEYDAVFIATVAESNASCVRLKYGPASQAADAADADKRGADPK